FAQEVIEGTASILILRDGGHIIAARDRLGRLPVQIGRDEDGYSVSFESFAYQKLGYESVYNLGPGEIVEISPDGYKTLAPALEKQRICAFLWSYYGYPNSNYDGINVEAMRVRNGAIMADNDKKNGFMEEVDSVSGVPDSGTAHAIGYANRSGLPFSRPFIKYTPTWPRSFTLPDAAQRMHIAKMKLIPVHEMIKGKRLLMVDDSIVRGTQLQETVEFLYEHGASAVHMRSACPPIMHTCKFLNFTRETSEDNLIARRIIRELEGEEGLLHLDEYADGSTERGRALRRAICEKMGFSSLEYQSLDGVLEAIGLPECSVCTYCWNGKE
ncbi:MAG: amidophosphoribosyltransferase, partial [Eubacteriales bacterium]|nr:amidophosphoribosyltransferase [Eubacteriales bacterium]